MKSKISYVSARSVFFLLFSFYFFAGCRSKNTQKDDPISVSESEDFYPEKVSITYSKGFTVKYFDHYKIVNIFSPFEKITDTTKYLLVERGSKRPDGYSDHQTIEIPIRSLVAMSSMHVGLLGFLESYNILTGLANMQYVYAPEVIEMIDEGKISEVGKDQGLNEEKLVTMHPDLIMTMGSSGAGMAHYQTLGEAGIPVLINSEWVETTPLARAEWVKLLAVLLNKEKLVNRKFSVVEKEYKWLADLAKESKIKPNIISGLNMKDTWFLPSGNSYMVQFFQDAGGAYHWSDTEAAGSLSLNFESVYPYALNADYWLNVGFDSKDTKTTILAQDSRYSDFKAYKSDKMYSYNNRVNGKGSNDFFESGSLYPQTVLADLIKILHPELLPEHQLVYYKQL